MIWWQDYRYSKKYSVKWGTNLINSFKDVWLEVLIIYLHLSHCTRRPQSLLQIFFLLIDEETVETVSDFLLGGSKIAADSDCSHEIKRCLLLGKKVTTNLNSILKSRHYFTNKGLSSQGYGFSSGHVWMWELDCKESWAPKKWCFWTVVLEKTLESPLDCKEILPVHPKGDQSWVLIGRTDAEAETLVLWPPHEKSWLIGKDPDDGRD